MASLSGVVGRQFVPFQAESVAFACRLAFLAASESAAWGSTGWA